MKMLSGSNTSRPLVKATKRNLSWDRDAWQKACSDIDDAKLAWNPAKNEHCRDGRQGTCRGAGESDPCVHDIYAGGRIAREVVHAVAGGSGEIASGITVRKLRTGTKPGGKCASASIPLPSS